MPPKHFPTGIPSGGASFTSAGRSIVGLVAATKSRTIGEDPHPCHYFPIARDLRGNDSLTGILAFVGAPVFLLLVAALACLAPARRAASIDPIRALKYE